MSTPNNVIDFHRQVSIEFLKSSQGLAVKTPKGQKDPGHFSWDPKANNRDLSAQTIFALERGDDNLGVHLYGRVVDVDLDTDNQTFLAALDHFMPYTAHVWGRKSRPRTHRVYELAGADAEFVPSMYPFLRALKSSKDLELEIRGGELKSGQYSLLPGSVHPSGETYEWADPKAARTTPVLVDLYKVLNGVRFAATAAALVPYWTEGVRHQMCLAVSGFFHRAAAHVADMGAMSNIFFNKDDARNLLEGIMLLAGDEESDRTMRLKTFEKTWEKGDAGQPVQGATTLTKITGDDNLLSLLYALLADTADLMEFDKFLDRYAIRLNTSNVIDLDKAGHRGASYVMSVNDFVNSHMHKTIATGSGERRQMTRILLASTRAIRVDGFAFIPGEEHLVTREDGKYVNQWRGFEIEMHKTPVTKEDVQVFLDYMMEVIACGDEVVFNWVVSWVADIFRKPERKSGTALVLVGKPGAGKSFLGHYLIRSIIGRNHSMQTNNIESIVGNFNMDSANMLFIQCDEAINSRRIQDANKLKSYITDPTKRVEPKGVNAYEVEDCARFLLTSNDTKDAVAIVDGQEDRRYTVLHVSDKYATNGEVSTKEQTEYWKMMHAWASDKENLAKLHRFLYDWVYDEATIRKPLDTVAKRNIQQHSQRGFDDWLLQIVAFEHPLENLRESDQKSEESYIIKKGKLIPSFEEWPSMISYRRLEDSYGYYKRRKGMSATTPSFNAQQIRQEFIDRRLVPPEPKTARVTYTYEKWENGAPVEYARKIRVSEMPKKGDIEGYLMLKLGYTVTKEEDVSHMFEGDEPPVKETKKIEY